MANETPPQKFEHALAELDRVLRELEDGTTTLEDALTRYERGVALVKQCYGQLRDAEHRIRELTGIGDDGKPILKTFEHTASVEKDNSRPNRRIPPPSDTGY